MTNIEEGNKIIAEFMNKDLFDSWVGQDGFLAAKNLQYHTSWDRLMPVVEKIEKMQTEVDGYFGVSISSNSCTIQGTKFRSDDKYCKAYFSDHYGETKIEATWKAVVQFIQK